MTETIEARGLVSGFSWPECPRWHNGHCYFTDMFSGRILELDTTGNPGTYADLTVRVPLRGRTVVAAGTGFLPDGRLLIVSMFEQTVLSFDGSELRLHADLSELATGPVNDMVVDAHGRAYITQLGSDIFVGEHPRDSHVLVVEPDGYAHIAQESGLLAGANGIAISADGRTLITAETYADRIIAYDLDTDGKLGAGRIFAEGVGYPDGICLDEEGAVWACAAARVGAVRVLEGGKITHEVHPPYAEAGLSVACCLGGPDRRTLYIACGFEVNDFDKSVREAKGSIWIAPAPVAGGACRP
ncbi:SMP-30/gluconolactonase/LRE family protein [Nocardia miyunensis]|uniref:SMP-30/gluconolactonase/LRE family protein n=1 Tax=Nocardia miyunensis TaxID=282684 RepID=UPI00082A2972|nr:SMP-30/gluconolactonase/LRE family protein [Nocardia miyunensis]